MLAGYSVPLLCSASLIFVRHCAACDPSRVGAGRARKEWPLNIAIRQATAPDFPRILELNADEVRQTSPLDAPRLAELDALAAVHWVVLRDGSVEGFLLAMDADAGYRNDNFDWFAQRYQRFLYVDRIVVSRRSAGSGLGRALYAALFAHARATQCDSVVCEINLDPPNPASIAFHARHGFAEVGQQQLAAAGKRVSMQRAPVMRQG